jgi:multiple sugar transport system ATP-binding protein
MAEIVVDSLEKTYPGGRSRATDQISLRVADGEFLVLVGPSGCGKTTLLRMIAGLERPDGGAIRIGGTDVTYRPARHRNVSMVFQSYAIFPHLTVRRNIGFGLAMHKAPRAEYDRKVAWAAGLLHLEEYLDRYPAQLSGGQRQRVAVARAIVVDADVLLMDEPLSNLDALLRLQFRAELKKLVRQIGITTVYVTHDQAEALSLGDRVAVMRDGRVVQIGPPLEVYDRPADQFVGGFLGSPPMNFLPVRVDRSTSEARLLVGEHGLPAPGSLPEGELILGVRAESIEVSAEPVPGALPATVEVIEPTGSAILLTVDLAGSQLKAQTAPTFRATVGQRLWFTLDPDRLRYYDPATGRAIDRAPS